MSRYERRRQVRNPAQQNFAARKPNCAFAPAGLPSNGSHCRAAATDSEPSELRCQWFRTTTDHSELNSAQDLTEASELSQSLYRFPWDGCRLTICRALAWWRHERGRHFRKRSLSQMSESNFLRAMAGGWSHGRCVHSLVVFANALSTQFVLYQRHENPLKPLAARLGRMRSPGNFKRLTSLSCNP